MVEEKKEPIPLNRAGLAQPPENFRVLLDIDGKEFGIVLTAFNRRSIVALLQTLMIVNRRRISGYVVRTEGLIDGSAGQLVASVPAAQFVGPMILATSLKNPAPATVPKVELKYWKDIQMKAKDASMSEEIKTFMTEVVIDGVAEKYPITGPNAESVCALLTAATCDKLPRIAGWNLYDEAGQLIASVPAIKFLAEVAEATPLSKMPADPKSAGWRVMPAVAPTNEEWQKTIDAAKKAGKTST